MKGELGIVHAKVDKLLARESRQSAVQSNQSVSGVLADALRGLVGIAMHAVRSSKTPVVGELVLGVLLEGPLKRRKVALAYSIVRKVDEESPAPNQDEGPAPNQDNAKLLLRIIRDLLVLLICGSEATRPWDNARMRKALNSAFDKDEDDDEEVDDDLVSQHLQALNKIVLHGKDRAKFDRHIAKAYGEHLDPQLADQIFAAFAECAQGSPQYVSNAKVLGLGKNRTPRQKRADSPAAAAEAWYNVYAHHWPYHWPYLYAHWPGPYGGFPLQGHPPGLGASSSDRPA